MKINFKILIGTWFVFGSSITFSQVDNGALLGQPAPRVSVREADIMWMNTVWQKIDLRQKFNYKFYFPTNPGSQGRFSLFDYLKNDLRGNSSFKAYDPGVLGNDDMFSKAFTKTQIDSLFTSYRDVAVLSLEDPNELITVTVPLELTTEDVLAYELKEYWYFDKQRSVMEVKIVGLCPIIRVLNQQIGEFIGEKRLFWIYLPEAQKAMSNWPVYNAKNTADQLTYDDILLKRMFHSEIIKTSNVYDRYIFEYASGADALIEAEKEKMKLFYMENDLWCY